MRGLDIKVTGANFWDQATEYDCAVPQGLKYLGIFGGSLGRSIRNFAPGFGDAVPFGPPDVGDNYIGIQSAVKYLQLPFGDDASCTYVLTVTATDTHDDNAHSPLLFGTAGSGGAGSNLYADDGTRRFRANSVGMAGGAGAQPTVALQTVMLDTPVMLIASLNSDTTEIYNMTTGQQTVIDNPAGYAKAQKSPLFVGGGPGTSKLGKANLHQAAYYSRKLSSTERAALYAQFKALSASLGLAI